MRCQPLRELLQLSAGVSSWSSQPPPLADTEHGGDRVWHWLKGIVVVNLTQQLMDRMFKDMVVCHFLLIVRDLKTM